MSSGIRIPGVYYVIRALYHEEEVKTSVICAVFVQTFWVQNVEAHCDHSQSVSFEA